MNHIFIRFAICTLLPMTALQAAKPTSPAKLAAALLQPTHARVSYGKDRAQFVDVYLAKSDKPTPVIIYIHGGGWNGGSAGGITRTDVFGAFTCHGCWTTS